MTDDPRQDRLLDAALGGPSHGLSPEEKREAARLARAFRALAAGAEPAAPPPALREKILAAAGAPRRRWRVPLALAAGALLAAGLSFFEGPAVRVTALSGAVLSDGKPVTTGDRLKPGSVLETAPGAWVRLALGRRAAALAREGARLTIPRPRGAFELKLARGSLLSRVRPGARYAVVTPTAAAAVRGTTFFVRADAGRSYVCLCQGKLDVTVGGETRHLETDHHAALTAGPAGFAPAGMEGHADEDAAALVLP